MEIMQLTPIRPVNHKPIFRPLGAIEEAVIIDAPTLDIAPLKERKHFIEANTKEVTLQHLKNECVIPVFSKDNEVTISHTNFIETVWEAATKIFPNERIDAPCMYSN